MFCTMDSILIKPILFVIAFIKLAFSWLLSVTSSDIWKSLQIILRSLNDVLCTNVDREFVVRPLSSKLFVLFKVYLDQAIKLKMSNLEALTKNISRRPL